MLALFRVLADRLKALFVADLASDFEAELLSREAERRAELLRLAQHYQDQGLKVVADRLRQQAEELSFQSPLAGVLPALAHLQITTPERGLPAPADNPKSAAARRRIAPATVRKGGQA